MDQYGYQQMDLRLSSAAILDFLSLASMQVFVGMTDQDGLRRSQSVVCNLMYHKVKL